jgi:hypothetical protein
MTGPDGQLYFDAGVGGWKSNLHKVLGKSSGLLSGVYMVMVPSDTRLCIACPTRVARGHLLAALRGARGVRASPWLDGLARDNKRCALSFAHSRGLRVLDKGDIVGILGPRGQGHSGARMVDVHLPRAEFEARLTAYFRLGKPPSHLPGRPAAHPPAARPSAARPPAAAPAGAAAPAAAPIAAPAAVWVRSAPPPALAAQPQAPPAAPLPPQGQWVW